MQTKIHPQYDRQFVSKSFEMIQQFLERTLKGDNQVINFKLPQELSSIINFRITPEPCPEEELLKTCEAILDYQVKPYHPHFHNQLFGGFDQYSYVGAVMAPSINGSVFTYEISPCYTLMENYLYDHLRTLIGWEKVDGTMTPGGSFANFMGLELARFRAHPEANVKGIYGLKPMKVLTSDVSHYSMKKGMILTGAGTQNLIYIKTDYAGRMIPEELEKVIQREIEAGNQIMMVNSTVGTTVEGSIDPVTEIGEICKKYNIWHHMDAAFGGAFIMSEQLIKKIGSFENVDSIAFDPHKALVVPLQATFFLCKHPGLMASSNSLKADYLFHKERASYSGELDVGDKHLQCGRVIDVLKLWTYLKGNGWTNIAKQVEEEHRLALYIKQYALTHHNFQLVIDRVDTFNVCFWIIPAKMSKKDFAKEEDFYALLSKVTVLAKKFMIEEGKVLIGYSKSKLPYYFWRNVMSNPFFTTQQVEFEMGLLVKYCEMAYNEIMSEQ